MPDEIPPSSGAPPPIAPPTAPAPIGQQVSGPRHIPSSDERTMAMLCHLLALFTGFIGPLIVWLIKKNRSRFVDAHGRTSLNFHFSMMLCIIPLICVGFLPLGACLMLPAVLGMWIFQLVMVIVHCVEASNGGYRRYPLAIPFFSPTDPYAPPPAPPLGPVVR